MQLDLLRTHGINCVGQVVMNPEGVLLVPRVIPRTSFLSKAAGLHPGGGIYLYLARHCAVNCRVTLTVRPGSTGISV